MLSKPREGRRLSKSSLLLLLLRCARVCGCSSGGGPLVAVMGDGFEGAKEKVVAACASTRRGHHMEAVGAALVAARLDWPVTRWIADAVSLRSRSGKNTPPPLIVGVSGPQGCGKSTLCSALVVR
ncbi:hypothetical protein Esti_006710 [Eimeria stiedai]